MTERNGNVAEPPEPAYSFLRIGDVGLRRMADTWDTTLATIFAETDLVHVDMRGGPGMTGFYSPVVHTYTAKAGHLRERLDLAGCTVAGATTRCAAVVRARVMAATRDDDIFGGLFVPTLTLDDVLSTVTGDHADLREEDLANLVAELDVYDLLRLVCDRKPDVEIALDVSQLVHARVVDATTPLCANARSGAASHTSRVAPLVVLTEGSSDARLLRLSLDLLKPHLAGRITFFDYDQNVEGGASQLLKQLRSFAAAGVANRVVALADNDTAAFDCLAKAVKATLPANVRLLHYPDLPSLRSYPTYGPQSPGLPVDMDVNGLAPPWRCTWGGTLSPTTRPADSGPSSGRGTWPPGTSTRDG